jgi:uncharacterized SAM-binding protein YcdF (DUF218 family)
MVADMEAKKKRWGLLRQRQCLVPTWRGWLALALIFMALGTVAVRRIHPFLAVNEPLPGGLLIVEGWASDHALAAAIAEFNRNHYEKVYVTGGPLEVGSALAAYRTWAELGAASLVKLGLSSNVVQAVPAPQVKQDRTYTSALSLRDWLQAQAVVSTKVHLMTEGSHARRSRLLFQRALGKSFVVGVTAMPVSGYDAAHWWRSSAGFRGVVDEALAYGYARLFF